MMMPWDWPHKKTAATLTRPTLHSPTLSFGTSTVTNSTTVLVDVRKVLEEQRRERRAAERLGEILKDAP